jgi:hypothetical protein
VGLASFVPFQVSFGIGSLADFFGSLLQNSPLILLLSFDNLMAV